MNKDRKNNRCLTKNIETKIMRRIIDARRSYIDNLARKMTIDTLRKKGINMDLSELIMNRLYNAKLVKL